MNFFLSFFTSIYRKKGTIYPALFIRIERVYKNRKLKG